MNEFKNLIQSLKNGENFINELAANKSDFKSSRLKLLVSYNSEDKNKEDNQFNDEESEFGLLPHVQDLIM